MRVRLIIRLFDYRARIVLKTSNKKVLNYTNKMV